MAGGAQNRRLFLRPLKMLLSFPSNHVLFCWELPPRVSHLPTSFLPTCRGKCSNPLPQCSADALREETLLWHCEHMALSLKKKNNKISQNLTFTMACCI